MKILLTLVLLILSSFSYAIDNMLPRYYPNKNIEGNFKSLGSNTMFPIMIVWGEAFKKYYPQVKVHINGIGSSTAPPALIKGDINIGAMSRKMTDKEIKKFKNKYGYEPTLIPVAIDALAVFVHKDNPLQGLTLQQLDAIFSKNRKCGANLPISYWSQLKVSIKPDNIIVFGRNDLSGTHFYFRKQALCKGEFHNKVMEKQGSASLVANITIKTNAIGYSGMGYDNDLVHKIAVAVDANHDFIAPSAENAASGEYPLARFLYLYVNKAPNKPLPKLEQEFLKLVLSYQGQMIVSQQDFIPLNAIIVKKYRELLH